MIIFSYFYTGCINRIIFEKNISLVNMQITTCVIFWQIEIWTREWNFHRFKKVQYIGDKWFYNTKKVHRILNKVHRISKKFINVKNLVKFETSLLDLKKVHQIWKKFIGSEKRFAELEKSSLVLKKVHRIWKKFIGFKKKINQISK